MGSYDTERVNEVRILLDQVRTVLPSWTGFSCDYPVEFKRIVHWLLTNSDSPLEWQRDGKPMYKSLIEWATHVDGTITWTSNISSPAMINEGGRVGRIRFRKPRTT